MTMQQSRATNLGKPVLIQRSTRLSLSQVNEGYFERLAAFGIACIAAAVVGKLVMTALQPKDRVQGPASIEPQKHDARLRS